MKIFSSNRAAVGRQFYFWKWIVSVACYVVAVAGSLSAAEVLPDGVKAVWDLGKSFREKTQTRERVSLNGLWRWQPASDEILPTVAWGYFKVPGSWPGITDYMQKDFQTLYAHPDWKNTKLGSVGAAWYQREITIPAEWAGRRIAVTTEYVNSFAAMFVDGNLAGEIRFPSGEVDVTKLCTPGSKHLLSLRVNAMPLKGVMLSYNDTNRAKEVKGEVRRRGLCGDIWLVAIPLTERIADVKVETSVRKSEVTVSVVMDGLAADLQYTLRAAIRDGSRVVHEFSSPPFNGGRVSFTEKWKPAKLWDIHTPQNQFELSVTLLDAKEKPFDTSLPVRFGFRELWIDGRDFYLNGSRIFLSAVPLDNAEIGAATATYEAAKESLLRLKSFGINFVYTHNYDCNPGSHLSFEEIFRAADDVGMLVSFSQPHFSNYDWKAAAADANNGYARHAEFYVHVAQNHPSVVFYSMSHNSTGYNEDMNPDLIDGKNDPRDNWAKNNMKLALRAEAIVHRLDPSRIIYHHSSGNLGPMHNSNFYPNFAPIQELNDWFEHWSNEGVKPMFTCEYGAPFGWDWTMYRGWHNGKRDFGSARVPWEYCSAEWNAQFLGDRAFKLGEFEKDNLRFEAKQFREGKLFYRWDYPHPPGSPLLDDQQTVAAMYIADNWRAFRTRGLSANSPWDFAPYWKRRDGLDRKRVELKTDWDNLQRPGYSPDYIEQRYERMDVAFDRADWIPTASADALIRNNQPLLAYIAGKPASVTSKDHNFLAGETVEKQLVIVNNSRETVSFTVWWSERLTMPEMSQLTKIDTLLTGEQKRIPLYFNLPARIASGAYELHSAVISANGEKQNDSFTINILAPQPAVKSSTNIALFDPKGETTKLLGSLGVRAQAVDANADLSAYDTLVVGKGGLSTDAPAPSIAHVRDGLKVVMFEQTSDVLEKRFGFRTAEYGLRQVWPRVPDHPLLAGLDADTLRDWRGAATILPSRLTYKLNDKFNGAPTVKWLGMDVPRIWRSGNRGNVASVLIEKPARGDFLPVVDGGFSLQYSPLMEYREGKGMILFCQMDVTGRTENDPAAERIVRNIFNHVAAWKPSPARKAFYVGGEAGKSHLEKIGVMTEAYDGGKLSADQVLIIGTSDGLNKIGGIGDGRVLEIGYDEGDKKSEHIAAFFEPFAGQSPFAGIGPADVHSRDPRAIPLKTNATKVFGNGVLAENDNVIYCQLAPWQFDYSKQYNLKRTFRRTSFLVNRLLANQGVAGSTPILDRFSKPVVDGEKRWLDGLYLDTPEEMDDPYRFFRW